MIRRNHISVLLFLLLGLLLFNPRLAQAQLSVQSNYIEVWGDNTGDGTYGMFGLTTSPLYSPSQASVLYFDPSPSLKSTCYITCWVNGTDYDFDTASDLTPITATGTGLGANIQVAKTIIPGLSFTAKYQIVNNPITGLNPDTCMYTYTYQNTSGGPVTVGLRVVYDTDVNGVDGANISLNNGISTIPVNTMYRIKDVDLPNQWWGYDNPPPGPPPPTLIVTGVFDSNPYGISATEPDAVEVAWWQSVKGQGVWSIGPLGEIIGSPNNDSSVVAWWTNNGDETKGNYILSNGQSQTITNYIGLNQVPLLTDTPTPGPTSTPTCTSTPSTTNTVTSTQTVTNTQTVTYTQTVTNTQTVTSTPTVTATFTVTGTFTNTPTVTATPTPTCYTRVWPDPYNPKLSVRGTLKMDCLPQNGQILLFTVSGELIKTIPITSIQMEWNGFNSFGYPVATGIYFYVVEVGGAAVTRGKFLLINGH